MKKNTLKQAIKKGDRDIKEFKRKRKKFIKKETKDLFY